MSEPSNHVFIHAKQFLNIARFCDDADKLDQVLMAVISNYAFSIELMLKALDTDIVQPLSQSHTIWSPAHIETNRRGHDFKKIYDELPPDVKVRLSSKYQSITGEDVVPLLVEFKDYFVLSRYFHDTKSKIIYYPSKLRALAEGLEKVLNNWHV